MHSQPFDLVLLDIIIPEMDGYEVLLQLRSDDDALRHIPVSIDSAIDEVESVVRCPHSGAEVYFSKPVPARQVGGGFDMPCSCRM